MTTQKQAVELAIKALQYICQRRYLASEEAYKKGIDLDFAKRGHTRFVGVSGCNTTTAKNLKDWVTVDEFDLEVHFIKENVRAIACHFAGLLGKSVPRYLGNP